jgi:ubiquinone/menaquinone biosynthesis C-methylase UbiE
MIFEEEKTKCETSRPEGHHHRGKFSEGLVDKELILNALKIQPGQAILDAGCGNGYMSKAFSNLVALSGKVYALDNDTHFIDILKKETQGTNVEAMECDITGPIPINPTCVDLVYISTVIHGFSKQQLQGFLTEAKRLLKPNGILAIVEIEKKETSFGPPLNLRYSPEELQEVVPMAPLSTVRVGDHFYMQVFRNT